MSHPPSRLVSVTRAKPCLVCGGNHKCARSNDGLLLCGRRDGPQAGFHHLGPSPKDPTWHLYRVEDVFDDRDPTVSPFLCKPARCDWPKRARLLAAALSETARHQLAVQLGLPDVVLSTLMVGYQAVSNEGPVWFFPECDGKGEIIGLQRRYSNSEKRNLGARGLSLPSGWLQRSGPIFCPEGASDTLTLTALNMAAVGRPSNTGGVNYLGELLTQVPPTRQIIIVGENDQRPSGEWPGRDGAIAVACELSRRLGRAVSWTLPPTPCKDVRAWVKEKTLDPTCADSWDVAGVELETLLTRAARSADMVPEFDAPPNPLKTTQTVPTFPVEVLPRSLQMLVQEVALALGCPADYVGVGMLVLAGAALGNAWHLKLTPSHTQSAALFAALVGPPGSAKSPVLSLLGEPFHGINGTWVNEANRQRQEQEMVRLKMPIVIRRCVVDDFTTESLAPILLANPKGLVVVKDELAGLIHALNQYKGGKGHDRQFILSLWAGASVVTDRKSGDGPMAIHRPFVGILGGIQPSLLDVLQSRNRQVVLDDGLLDRFLFCYPNQPPVKGESWQVVSVQAKQDWHGVVKRLLDIPVKTCPGGWEGVQLELTPGARGVWQKFTEAHAEEVNEEHFPSELSGVWSKMRGYAGRLALVLEALSWACGEKPGALMVDSGSMKGAWQLVTYFKAHARKVHDQLQTDPILAGAERILNWLRERPGVSRFTRADMYQCLRRQFARPSAMDEPLKVLVEFRYLLPLTGGRVQTWLVNPLWYRDTPAEA